MNDQRNTIIAIVLSAIVLLGWNFYVLPQKQRQEAQQRQAPITQVQPAPQPTPGQPVPGEALPGSGSRIPGAAPNIPSLPNASAAGEQKSRETVIESA